MIAIAALVFTLLPASASLGSAPFLKGKDCIVYANVKAPQEDKPIECLDIPKRLKNKLRHARHKRQHIAFHIIKSRPVGPREDIIDAVRKGAVYENLWIQYNEWLQNKQLPPKE